jgi:protein SCO1/2
MMLCNRLIVLTYLLLLTMFGCQSPPEELRDLGEVPAFALTNQDGKPFGSKDLLGQVWVANFLFTSCPTSCPPLAKATAALQDLLRAEGKGKIVTISVDPMTDTPEVLTTFGRKYGADFAIWSLLTGDYDAMEKLVVEGFFQPLARKDKGLGQPAPAEATPLDTAHSLRFVLVDQRGHMRALYDKSPDDLKKLTAAVSWLSSRGP